MSGINVLSILSVSINYGALQKSNVSFEESTLLLYDAIEFRYINNYEYLSITIVIIVDADR